MFISRTQLKVYFLVVGHMTSQHASQLIEMRVISKTYGKPTMRKRDTFSYVRFRLRLN